MQKDLEAAKNEMQKTIDGILKPGAVVLVDSGDGFDIRLMVDRFDVLFAPPVFGPAGAVQDHYFWAVCFEVGFDNGGPQNVRLFKMKKVKEIHPGLIGFTDHRGWKCLLESLDEVDDVGRDDVRRWGEYKEEKKEQFDRLYRNFTDEHMEMALNMEAAGE